MPQALNQDGPLVPMLKNSVLRNTSQETQENSVSHAVLDCSEAVQSGEIEWSVKGFSWLKATLKDNELEFAQSPDIDVGGHNFQLCYSPRNAVQVSEFELEEVIPCLPPPSLASPLVSPN